MEEKGEEKAAVEDAGEEKVAVEDAGEEKAAVEDAGEEKGVEKAAVGGPLSWLWGFGSCALRMIEP
eukprot:SAG25_NODE_6541_length_552_cov_0.799117_2_plen_66_part_00